MDKVVGKDSPYCSDLQVCDSLFKLIYSVPQTKHVDAMKDVLKHFDDTATLGEPDKIAALKY